MWEFDHKEAWAMKNWCFWTVVLEKTLESPLDCKEIQPVHPKGDQSWVFTGRTDAEAEAPTFWPPDVKNWLFGKDPDAGKDWRQEEKGTIEDEVAGWHHQLDGHEFEQVPGRWWWTGRPGAAVHGVTKSWTRLRDRTTKMYIYTHAYTHMCAHTHTRVITLLLVRSREPWLVQYCLTTGSLVMTNVLY